jgi:hypothetical protein
VFRIVLPEFRLGQLPSLRERHSRPETARVPDEPIPRSGGTETAGLCEVNLPAMAASAAKPGND